MMSTKLALCAALKQKSSWAQLHTCCRLYRRLAVAVNAIDCCASGHVGRLKRGCRYTHHEIRPLGSTELNLSLPNNFWQAMLCMQFSLARSQGEKLHVRRRRVA